MQVGGGRILELEEQIAELQRQNNYLKMAFETRNLLSNNVAGLTGLYNLGLINETTSNTTEKTVLKPFEIDIFGITIPSQNNYAWDAYVKLNGEKKSVSSTGTVSGNGISLHHLSLSQGDKFSIVGYTTGIYYPSTYVYQVTFM